MNDTNAVQVGIARIYVKDLSFESPRAPQIFQKAWRPEVKLNVSVTPQRIQENIFEVTLGLTVEAHEDGDPGFIVEIEQAGLFDVQAPEGAPLERILRVFCPSTLFPYARQAIDQALIQGGFPPLMLAQVNFEGLLKRAPNG